MCLCEEHGLNTRCLDWMVIVVQMAKDMFVCALCFCPYVHSHIKISLIKQSAAAHLHLTSAKRKINGRFVAGSMYILYSLFSHLEGERFVWFLPHKSWPSLVWACKNGDSCKTQPPRIIRLNGSHSSLGNTNSMAVSNIQGQSIESNLIRVICTANWLAISKAIWCVSTSGLCRSHCEVDPHYIILISREKKQHSFSPWDGKCVQCNHLSLNSYRM